MSRNIDAICLSKPGTINLPWGVADQLDVDEHRIEAHYDVRRNQHHLPNSHHALERFDLI